MRDIDQNARQEQVSGMHETGFADILHSHLITLRTVHRTPTAVLISDIEAGRFGLKDATAVLGLPIRRDNSIRVGRARLELNDGSRYEFALPVYFTED